MSRMRSGAFWMRFWLVAFGLVLVWAGLTFAFWMDSVRNLNAMSVAALVLAGAAGLQTTLTMRKADPEDPL